jgi:hypothetical protein
MKRLLALVCFLPPLVLAQTTRTVIVATGVDSMWSAATWATVTTNLSAALVGASGAVISTAPSGPVNVLRNITAAFPPMATGVTVAEIDLTISRAGNGWKSKQPEIIAYTLPVPLFLAAGEQATFSYDPSASLLGAALTATIVTPAPPSATVASKPGDKTPPLAQLTATDGAAWTLVAGKALRNGIDTRVSYADINYLYISLSNTIRANSATHGYVAPDAEPDRQAA